MEEAGLAVSDKLKMFPLLIDQWQGGTKYLTHQEKGFYLDLLLYLFTEQRPIKDHRHAARITGIDPRTSAKLWPKICQKFESNQHGHTHRLVAKILSNSGRIKGLDAGAYGVGFPAQEKEKEKEEEYKITPATAGEGKLPVSPLNGCPYQKIVNLYHETLPMLPRIRMLTDHRKANMRMRWKKEFPDMETWEKFFQDVGKSKFLTGKAQPMNGRRPFVADIDFLLKPGNIAKIAEGKYDG